MKEKGCDILISEIELCGVDGLSLAKSVKTVNPNVGVVAFILLAICTKKSESVVYNKLDQAGRVTNIVLIPIYACLLPACLFLGMISSPECDGF